MSAHDEEAMSESDNATLEALFEYVEAQGWCPMPNPWNRLWGLLLDVIETVGRHCRRCR